MSGKPKFGADEVIAAIPGTGGIVSALKSKLGCTWETANFYVGEKSRFPTIRAAWLAEAEAVLDVAESVVVRNIQYAAKLQTDKKVQVDTSDAKWLLSRKGKKRGYGDKVELGGSDSGPVILKVVYESKRNGAND